MSAEPNKSMEEQLRAFAESRRLECPPIFELDAPARQRLQDEVRRVYRAAPASASARLSMWIWTRVVLAGATAALILFLGLQLLPKEQAVLLSQQAERPAEPVGSEFAERSRHVSSPESQTPLKPSTPTQLAPAPSLTPTVTAITPMVADHSRANPADRGKDFELRSKSEPIPVSLPTARNEASFGVAAIGGVDMVGTVSAGQDYQQVQRYRRNPNSPPPPQVLQSFRWFSEGDAIRVIDADGSVYSGSMAMAPSSEDSTQDRFAVETTRGVTDGRGSNQVVLRQAESDGIPAGRRFALIGTNRTMNARVVFEGVLLPQAGLPRSAPSVGGAGQALAADAAQIQGQAVVGESTRIEIVAEPRIE